MSQPGQPRLLHNTALSGHFTAPCVRMRAVVDKDSGRPSSERLHSGIAVRVCKPRYCPANRTLLRHTRCWQAHLAEVVRELGGQVDSGAGGAEGLQKLAACKGRRAGGQVLQQVPAQRRSNAFTSQPQASRHGAAQPGLATSRPPATRSPRVRVPLVHSEWKQLATTSV